MVNRVMRYRELRFLITLILWLGAGGTVAAGYTPADRSEEDTSWSVTLVALDEPGEPMIVSGTVYHQDGKTPVRGALLYVYQTDAAGYYNRRDNWHGPPRIKGWMKTDGRGRYQFRAIKPAPYPNQRMAAHVYVKLRLPGGVDHEVEEYLFEGDPNIAPEVERRSAGKGRFSPIVRLSRGPDGILHGERDLRAE